MATLKTFTPSDDEFQQFEYAWPENGQAVSMLRGESVAVIGWIPFFNEPLQMPVGFLRSAWETEKSIAWLFSAGNAGPPREFANGQTDLIRYLAMQEFRGALSLCEPRLSLSVGGKPVHLTFRTLARVGYTAVRIPRLEGFRHYHEGVSTTSGAIAELSDRVVIRLFLRMKLGFLGQAFGRILMGSWPPWATLMLEYEFDTRYQQARVEFSGTEFPSQTRYLDWRCDSEYLLEEQVTKAGYDGFVNAGSCQDAMATRSSTLVPVKFSLLPDEGRQRLSSRYSQKSR
jgi:hypothetical protein